MSSQLSNEIIIMESHVEALEKERDYWKEMAERYQARNHAMLDILKKVKEKKVVKSESSHP